MHYDKQCNNDLIQNKINIKTVKNFKPSTSARETESTEINSRNSERILSFQVNTKNKNTIKEHEASDIGTYTEHTSASCTSSTDSGVNVSDNDEIPPSPTSSHLHSFPSTSSSSSEATTTTTKPFNKQFHKNNKNPNRDNIINNSRDNNYNNHFIDNYDRDHNDDDEDDDNSSTNTDNKLKNEQCRKRQQQLQQQQQFIKVENSTNGGNNTQYQQNQNVIESENSLNISQQRDSTISKIRVTFPPPPAATTTTSNNDKTSLQHNEFTNRPQRSASISSSLSMSSIMSTQSDDPPSKTHHRSGSVVSIRSINSSTIITSDSDSDSDLSGDTEGAHSNYVIKKLGTQVSYPPKHPAIPNINSGHTVLNQKVVPNCEHLAASPLATLAAIGDSIGAAQALGPVPSFSAVPQRPQIGSIALSNSSDVTFGDKHFYEGPVTIQQFLIDSRDKWKETNEKENPTFVNENGETSNNAKDINPSAEQSDTLYGYISKRKKIFIPGVLAFMTMLIVGIILGSRTLSDSKSKLVLGNSEESRNIIPINSTIAQDNVGGGYILRMVPRDGWLAQPPLNNWVPLNLPVKRVIVIPTRTQECETQASCTYTVRITQTYNIESQQQDDIIYNFLIGGDGNVYEGRGWNNKGSLIKGFNDDSISFAYIGSFKKQPPSYRQLNVTKLLLEEGVRLKKLSPDYEIVGANKLDPTSVTTIADALYKSFENWPHWSDK